MLKTLMLGGFGALGGWRLTRRLTRDVPRIFMLHRFSTHPQSRGMHVDEFVKLVDVLAARCELVTVRELAGRLARPVDPGHPLAAITVDDGYEDFYRIALPVLAERKVPATLYATAGFIDGRCWLWWDALRFLLDAHPAGEIELRLRERNFLLTLGDAASRAAAWEEVADYLVTRNEDRALALAGLDVSGRQPLPDRPTPDYAPMSWAQLAEAEAAGIEIGGHTMTHAYLPTLDSAALRHELDDARELLEAHLAASVRTFAYPNGMPYDWSPEVETAVKQAGFEAAVLAHPRRWSPTDPYRIGRWSVKAGEPRMNHILNGASELKLAWRKQ